MRIGLSFEDLVMEFFFCILRALFHIDINSQLIEFRFFSKLNYNSFLYIEISVFVSWHMRLHAKVDIVNSLSSHFKLVELYF